MSTSTPITATASRTPSRDDPRVVTISIHEAGRWPRTGETSDPARGVHNYPVPPDFNDSEFALILEEGILPTVAAAAPDLIVLQGGADALAEDPLSRLALSNLSHRRTVDGPARPGATASGAGRRRL